MSNRPQLIQNAVKLLKEDLYLVSTHRHDFIGWSFDDLINPETGNSFQLHLDGGTDYLRRGGTDFAAIADRYEEYWLDESMPFDYIAQRLLWGTRGKDGKQPLTYRPIREFTTDHLQAILDNVPYRAEWHDRVVHYWLDAKTKDLPIPSTR